MHRVMRTLLLAGTLAWSGLALAQTAGDDRVPPAAGAATELPRADETNAERAKTQPGNNATLWRAVRDSGNKPGFTMLPGVEQGVLVQSFVQYPGSDFTTAGEAWRQLRNEWIIPYGGSLLLFIAGAIALFYWRKGMLGGHEPDTGRRVERFTPTHKKTISLIMDCSRFLFAPSTSMTEFLPFRIWK